MHSSPVVAGNDGLASQYNDLRQDVIDRAPIGSALMWFTGVAPTGYLFCEGQAVSRATYADLFALIGTTYGAGDGSTTFNLPDLRDRFPIGASGTKALATTGGSETITTAQLPAHSHGIETKSAGGAGVGRLLYQIGQTAGTSDFTTRTEGSGSAYWQPYLAVHFIIKI